MHRRAARLSFLAFFLLLTFSLVACSSTETASQNGISTSGTDSGNDKTKKPKDKDHKHGGVIPAKAKEKELPIPGPLPIKNGPIPITGNVQSQAVGDQVQLKFLLIALDANDFGLPTLKAVLDQMGAPYDVFLAKSTPLTSSTLVDTDSSGKYNAILLTNNSLLYPDGTGNYVSAFDGNEWNTLWNYERTYKVRQVSFFTSYGTFPEDYCLRPVSEGSVGLTPPLNANLTSSGATIFNELRYSTTSPTNFPVANSYVYRNSIATGTACSGASATALLTAGTATGSPVLGVISPTTDGRQRLALTFTTNQYILHNDLFTYSLLRWASRGLFIGERRHYLNVDVDDWFNTADERNPDGTFVPGGYSMTAADAYNTFTLQRSMRTKYPALNSAGFVFTVNMAYNGEGANLSAPANGTSGTLGCLLALPSPDPLTSTTRCLRNDFNFINHTLTHLKLNDPLVATAAAVRSEIRDNLTVGNTLGLKITDATVLKTGEYSGLGVYNPNPNDDLNPPTDFGLMASNINLLTEATAAGIKYLHGNMSFVSHQPPCFNCGIYHPMQTNLLLVPDWPTNIAYLATNPAEEVSIYNCFFGPTGTCAGGSLRAFSTDQTYTQIINNETNIALANLARGSVYSYTFHIANLRQYQTGKNLLFDWVDALVGKYSNYFSATLRNLPWQNLGAYVAWKTSHFGIKQQTKAVWDRVLNTVKVTSPAAGTLYISGASATGVPNEIYNTNSISRLTLAANATQTLTPASYVATLGSGSGSVSLQSAPQDSTSPDQ